MLMKLTKGWFSEAQIVLPKTWDIGQCQLGRDIQSSQSPSPNNADINIGKNTMLQSSGFQPGVRVPPGVREKSLGARQIFRMSLPYCVAIFITYLGFAQSR